MEVRARIIILFLIVLSLSLLTDSGCRIQSTKDNTASTVPVTTLYAAKQRNEYAINLVNEGKYEEAIAELTQAIDICPEYAELYFNRGTAYCWIEEYEKAIEDYNAAISMNESYHEAYNGRGYAYSGMDEYNVAIANYTEAISIEPTNAEYLYNRGCAYKALENELEASSDLHECIERSSDPVLTQKARQALSGLE
jgi:tetratricopeptide (TPR) repeat protein